eukprot:CAMPEP_0184437882 /NCGR_PEP_ID=MMETSP0738-20130409/620975_1 /TAXON_ID=385413 /ORGANISM="Thalassiosira miniscula, Strain CCMP1093" /LENGTH=49 /DNA_ID=CAMNT_0026805029 /DNA_START=148 /DNA_END=297 /DNA_ORIENTATION=-
MASVRGLRRAETRSEVRRKTMSTRPAMGTDQITRCATTSSAGMWATSFI